MKNKGMKKIALMIAGLLLMVLYSCRSVQFNMNEASPLAVVTVFSNPTLPWYDPLAKSKSVPDDSVPSQLIKKSYQENPELNTAQKRIDSAYLALIKGLEDAGIEVVDREAFSDSDEYQKLSKSFLSGLETDLSAEGLKILDYMNGKKYLPLAELTDAGSMMFVEFTFNKQKTPVGLHDNYILARTTMNVYIYDRTGKKVFHKKYTGLSETGPLDDNGSYNKNELVEKFPETVDFVVDCLLKDLLGE